MLDEIIITGFPSYQSQIQSASLAGAKWIPSQRNYSLQRAYEIAAERQARG